MRVSITDIYNTSRPAALRCCLLKAQKSPLNVPLANIPPANVPPTNVLLLLCYRRASAAVIYAIIYVI